MRWWVRFALWSLVLFPLAWVALEPYHRFLVPLVTRVLYAAGISFEVRSLDLLAPYDLAFFLGMTLATNGASYAERARAITLGVIGLVVAETLFAAIAIAGVVREAGGHPLPATIIAVRDWTAP